MVEEIKLNDFLGKIKKYIKPFERVFIVGVSGGSGSGKTYVAKKICSLLQRCKMLSMDDYIIPEKVKNSFNWDLPEIWDLLLIKRHIVILKNNKKINKPTYNFDKNIGETEEFGPEKIIVLEGNYALHQEIFDLIDFKIFVDAPEKVRLNRRIKRDIVERGRTKETIKKMWKETVQPIYEKLIKPQKKLADLIVVNN